MESVKRQWFRLSVCATCKISEAHNIFVFTIADSICVDIIKKIIN